MSIQQLPLSSIVVDRKIWPRRRLDEGRVSEFTELLEEADEDPFPPIVVAAYPRDPNIFLILDGVHRVEAYKRAGRVTCPAEVLELPCTYNALVPEAVRRSAVSAKPLTRLEKRAAVVRLLELCPGMSDREIARIAGVSHPTVAAYRRDGRFTSAEEPSRVTPRVELPAVERLLGCIIKGFRARLYDDVTSDDITDFVSGRLHSIADDQSRRIEADQWMDLASVMYHAAKVYREP
jgi:hypothetical protein